jgi:DNA repair protein RadC
MADLPVDDRPRERLLQRGAVALSDAELIAVQLGSGHAGASALSVAQRLLADWGDIAALVSARPEDLARVKGVGAVKAARLASAFGIAMRLDAESAEARLFTSEDIAAHARPLIGRARTEQVAVLIADGGSRLKRTEIIASGTAKSCPMPVREIIATVLRHDGLTFAVAHNHPGGDPAPSAADPRATALLREAADTVGLRFLDHVVVTATDWRSARANKDAMSLPSER